MVGHFFEFLFQFCGSVFWPPFPLYGTFSEEFPRSRPVLREFGFILQAGVWHSTSVVQALPWGQGWLRILRKPTKRTPIHQKETITVYTSNLLKLFSCLDTSLKREENLHEQLRKVFAQTVFSEVGFGGWISCP